MSTESDALRIVNSHRELWKQRAETAEAALQAEKECVQAIERLFAQESANFKLALQAGQQQPRCHQGESLDSPERGCHVQFPEGERKCPEHGGGSPQDGPRPVATGCPGTARVPAPADILLVMRPGNFCASGTAIPR